MQIPLDKISDKSVKNGYEIHFPHFFNICGFSMTIFKPLLLQRVLMAEGEGFEPPVA